MQARVSKWGNSLAIRLPKAAAESLRVQEGEAIDLTIEGEAVILRPRRPRYTLDELVNAMKRDRHPEIFDDMAAPPVGDELL